MANFRLTTVLSTLLLVHGFFVYVCQSCSPPEGWRPPTLVDNILRANNVLYGLVRDTYPDERHSTAYTVELEVYCILKGAMTPSVINITGGGWIPGHCEASKYLASHVYVVRAYNHGQADQPLQLTISGGEINATQENLQEVTKACGLNPVTRPIGLGSSSTIECPVSASECQSEPTPNIERPVPPNRKDPGDAQQSDYKSSTSASSVTVATTTLAATAAAALVLNKIIN